MDSTIKWGYLRLILENIQIKPSAEYIPDEYEHSTNLKYSVHIFCDENHQECANTFGKTLKEFEYKFTTPNNIHCLSNCGSVEDALEDLKQETDLNALILVFMGSFINEFSLNLDDSSTMKLSDIWTKFTTTNCPSLKNKPKLFLFFATSRPSNVQMDGRRHATLDKLYDVPVEADMLIIFKKFNEPFINQPLFNDYCNYLKCFASKYHIIDLMINNDLNLPTPIIVSTLTRKFYLTISQQRGQILSMTESFNSIIENLKDIQRKIDNIKRIKAESKEKEKHHPPLPPPTKPHHETSTKSSLSKKTGAKGKKQLTTDEKTKKRWVY